MSYIILSFEPLDSQHLPTSDYAISLINDTDSDIFFSFISEEDNTSNQGSLLSGGSVEAGMSLTLEISSPALLRRWERFLFFAINSNSGKGKPIQEVSKPISSLIILDNNFWRKEQSYGKSFYSDNKSIEIELAKDGKGIVAERTDAHRLKLAMGGAPDDSLRQLTAKYSSDSIGRRRQIKRDINPRQVLPPIEIDLHIDALLDSTAGMNNTDMLLHQLETIRNVLNAHSRRHGQKIIFIHGKGEGVLRKALYDLVKREFSRCELQDASFVKYGFGATMVIIHP